ncbi:hypothetical protein Hdeb2414_s0005g00182861 [Helianthus debilis subsp. tardiflorus]
MVLRSKHEKHMTLIKRYNYKGCKRTERTRTRPCSCSFVKKYMCSRTVHEHLSN